MAPEEVGGETELAAEPAKVPWRKNLLMLFGIGYLATACLYIGDLAALSRIEEYASHAGAIIEVFKILTIGAVALAKDMIR